MAKTEKRIMQDCFVWFNNTYPHLRGLYFRIKNEGTNKISGAIDKATGVIPGVSDACLLPPHMGNAVFIEYKTENGRVSKSQQEWAKRAVIAGYNYHVVTNLDEFKDVCKTYI